MTKSTKSAKKARKGKAQRAIQIAPVPRGGLLGEWTAWLATAPISATLEKARALGLRHAKCATECAAYCALHFVLGVSLTVIFVWIGLRSLPSRE